MICEGLTLSLNGVNLLENISFSATLEKGKMLGILGASGCGKTLLLRSLARLEPEGFELKAGRLTLNGEELLKLTDLPAYRRKVAYIFQDAKAAFPPLLDIGRFFGMCGAKKQEAFDVFERLGLSQTSRIWHAYPYELSSGEAMRVQVALALVCGAKILLCDEITSNLDEKNARSLLELLRDFPCVLITHDLAVAREFCAQILLLNEGRVVEFNSEFFTAPKSEAGKQLVALFNGEF